MNEQRSSGRFSARGFYIRRVFRIVPPFFLYLAFVLLAAALGLIVQEHRETLIAAAFTCSLPGIDCGLFAGQSDEANCARCVQEPAASGRHNGPR